MASNSCTFIIVPDATSQCKRYHIPKSFLYIAGISGVSLIVVLGIVLHTALSEYRTMSMKINQLEKLKKISLSQKGSIDRYEEDILQLSKHLTRIKQLNNRLMMLAGLDPTDGENNLGLGGSEDIEANPALKKAQSADNK